MNEIGKTEETFPHLSSAEPKMSKLNLRCMRTLVSNLTADDRDSFVKELVEQNLSIAVGEVVDKYLFKITVWGDPYYVCERSYDDVVSHIASMAQFRSSYANQDGTIGFPGTFGMRNEETKKCVLCYPNDWSNPPTLDQRWCPHETQENMKPTEEWIQLVRYELNVHHRSHLARIQKISLLSLS